MSEIQWVDVQAILIGSRFVDSKHLGLGDIRLTIDEQDRIVDYVAKLEAKVQELEDELKRCEDDITFYGNEIAKHKAKVQELQFQNNLLMGDELVINKIKAEGIEEMLIHFDLFDLDKDKHGFGEYLAELREGER